MLSAQGFGQHERRVTLVEEEDLAVRTARKFAVMVPRATLLPPPVGPKMAVCPVSLTCRLKRNGVLPLVAP